MRFIAMLIGLFRKPKPAHEHTMCKYCVFLGTDKVGKFDVDKYVCHVDGSDLWTFTLVYGDEYEQYKAYNACI